MSAPAWFENRINIQEINFEKQLNQKICLAGFARNIRKLGKLCFVNLVDTTTNMQLVFQNDLLEKILKVPKESSIGVYGTLVLRKEPNPNQLTGQYEIIVDDFYLFSAANLTPFTIKEQIDATEDTKLKYRYLDLRSNTKNNIKNRSKIINLFRSFLLSENFDEIETPILGRSTPEGARDYLVPIRTKNFPEGFALPQSPQIFKQLLMVGGFEKYFQIARNFRDEDLRADRQPEFTQLDMELAYSSTPKLMNLIERMFAYVWKNFYGVDLKTPFLKISYDDCLNYYGTDKPDLRFDLKIQDLTEHFKNVELNLFQGLKTSNHVVKGLFLENHLIDKKQHQELEKIVKNHNLKGLLYATYDGQEFKGNLFKLLPEWTQNYFNQKTGSLILSVETKQSCLSGLGAVRNYLGSLFNLYDKNVFCFLWVIDWPLFEFNFETQKYEASHHPFTQPDEKWVDNFDKDLANAKASAYDLVLNGVELGSGSKRIYSQELQRRMFKALNLSQAEIDSKFGWFINAFQYGTPPHQGIGLGLDRILQLMLKTETIRDVIAFPKNNQGFDVLLNAPDTFSEDQLKVLNLKQLKENKK